MRSGDSGGGAAADVEGRANGQLAGFQGGYEIVEDRVNNGLVEDPFIAIREKVELEAFHLDASLVGDISDGDGGEIGLAGDRAEAGEFGEGEFYFVVPAGSWVGKGVEDRARLPELGGGEEGFAAQVMVGARLVSPRRHRCRPYRRPVSGFRGTLHW